MTAYQPGIPTGTVDLDVDYLNIQNNFQQLDTTYGVDHIPYSQVTHNGFHTLIHMVAQSSIPPVAVADTGELYTFSVNDGVNTDTALYYQTAGGRNIRLTGNFVPVSASNGYTFLPGGLIMQWGSFNPNVSTSVTFPIAFPNNVWNVQLTNVASATLTPPAVRQGTLTTSGFTYVGAVTTSINPVYFTAIGS